MISTGSSFFFFRLLLYFTVMLFAISLGLSHWKMMTVAQAMGLTSFLVMKVPSLLLTVMPKVLPKENIVARVMNLATVQVLKKRIQKILNVPHMMDQRDSDNSDAPTDEEGDNEAEEEFEVSTGSVDGGRKKSRPGKMKYSDIDEQINVADKSLRALKRLTEEKMGNDLEENDGILSNEDFRLIKERMAKKEVRTELSKHGFKIPTADQLTVKRVDASKLEPNIRKKFSKEERLEIIRAGREERGKYQARTALKKKKTGGSSNMQKEHKKAMPLAARRDKIKKPRQQKKIKNQRAGKQFRGRKAWK